jgi:acyl carrier protein
MGITISDRLSDDVNSKETRRKVRTYIHDNILLGLTQGLDDATSLLDAGILDSTGAMEIVAFLEEEFGIVMADEDIVADNLDSVDRICAYVESRRA